MRFSHSRYCSSQAISRLRKIFIWFESPVTLIRGNETLACAGRYKVLPNVKQSGEIRTARMANAIQRASFVVLNGSRLSRAFLTRRVLHARFPSLSHARVSLSLSLNTRVSFLVAARFRSSFSRVPPPASPIFGSGFFCGAVGRRNTSSVAEVPFNLLNSRFTRGLDSPWNVHLRYTVGSTATRDREDTLVNPFELTPVEMTGGTLGATARVSERLINLTLYPRFHASLAKRRSS